jgi:hypothetical protein
MSLESDGGMIYWQGKTKKFGENLSQYHFVHHKSQHGLTQERTRASAVRGRRLTTWVMARPGVSLLSIRFPLAPFLLKSSEHISWPVHVKSKNSSYNSFLKHCQLCYLLRITALFLLLITIQVRRNDHYFQNSHKLTIHYHLPISFYFKNLYCKRKLLNNHPSVHTV